MFASIGNTVRKGAQELFAPTFDPVKGEASFQPEDYSVTRRVEEYIEKQQEKDAFLFAHAAALACTGTCIWDAGYHSWQGIIKATQADMEKSVFHVIRAVRFMMLAPFALAGLFIPGAVKVIDEHLEATAIQGDYKVRGVISKVKIYTKRMYKGAKQGAKNHPIITATLLTLSAVGIASRFVPIRSSQPAPPSTPAPAPTSERESALSTLSAWAIGFGTVGTGMLLYYCCHARGKRQEEQGEKQESPTGKIYGYF